MALDRWLRISAARAVLCASFVFVLFRSPVTAATLYWDGNGATAGAGTNPSGIWGTSPFWSPDFTGSVATSNTTTTSLDKVSFTSVSGTSWPTGDYAITVNGTQFANYVQIWVGSPTFSGGTIALSSNVASYGAFAAGVSTGGGNATINSNVSILGEVLLSITAGKVLTLQTGTFTRLPGAELKVSGAGTVVSTMAGLTANKGQTGIIGPWANFDFTTSTTSARYATFSGSTIVPYTGTPAATAAALVDTTGLVNYDLAAPGGNIAGPVSANTIRYTGAAGTTSLAATSFSVNGLMNATVNQWTITGNRLTIGNDRELVVNPTSARIIVSGVIEDNAAGPSGLTKVGAGSLLISGANTYTGPTIISCGTFQLGSNATGSLSTASALINNGALHFTRTNTLTQGIDFANVISGEGSVAQTTTGTTVLTGMNTYTGPTEFRSGKISVSFIGNGGVAGNLGAASSAAANLLFTGGTLRYTGPDASTNRNFYGNDGTIEVTTNNLTLAGSGSELYGFNKTGAGTLTLAGSNSFTGSTTVKAGTLVLDYTARNSNLLSFTGLTLSGGTLQIDRATGASGTFVESLSSISVSGLTNITRGDGSLAVLKAGITRSPGGVVNFGGPGFVFVNNDNVNGIIGPWATVGGADYAVNSRPYIGDNEGPIVAYTGYFDLTRRTSGVTAIPDNSALNLRIVEGTGAAGTIMLSSETTTIQTLNQSSAGGAGPSFIDTAGKTLAVRGILVGRDAGGLTIGTSPGSGVLKSSVAGGELLIQHYGGSLLVINAVISGGFSDVTFAGPGKTLLTGTNTFSGMTRILGGTLQLGDDSSNGVLSNTYEVMNNGTLEIHNASAVSNSNLISGSGDFVKSGAGTLTLTRASTYTGTTTVSEGTLRLGDGVNNYALSSPRLINHGILSLDSPSFQNLSYAGNISGTGGLIKTGSGYYGLTGEITYTGGTTIASGTLAIGGTATAGLFNSDVLNNGALMLSRQVDSSYSGAITGTGTLTLSLPTNATLIFSGTNISPGKTTIFGGTVVIFASFLGDTTVTSGTLKLGSEGTGQFVVPSGRVLTNNATVLGSVLARGEITGRGVFTGPVTVGDEVMGGTLRPTATDTTTRLTAQQSLTLNGGSMWALTLSGDALYSRVAADSITLNSAVTLSATLGTGYDPLGSGKLFFIGDLTGANAVNGIFANPTEKLSFGDLFGGATYDVLTLAGEQFAISYTGDAGTQAFDVPGGHDIVLKAVPEPGSAAMLFIGVGAFLTRRPRRK